MEKLSSEDIGILVQPNPAYIKALVQKELIPTQKKFMAAALKSFCLSCEQVDYCAKKTDEVKCVRFQIYLAHYHNILVNELI